MWNSASSARAGGSDLGQALEGNRVGGVRGEADLDAAGLPVPAGVEVGDLANRPLPPRRPSVLSGKLEHPRGHDRAQAGRSHRIDEGVGVEVGLAAGRHPETEQLGGSQCHAPEDVVLGQMGFAGPEDLGQPSLHGEPVADTAEERHRGVAVGVDQPRQ